MRWEQTKQSFRIGFKLLKELKDKFHIVFPYQVWSGDEMGVQNVPKEVKVLGCKNIQTFQQVSGEQGRCQRF